MKILNLESEVQLSPNRKNFFAFVSLFIIILSIYSNTFDASWHFDDVKNIIDRKEIHLTQLTWTEIKKTFFFEDGKYHGKLYRPVANFTLALNYYFGKTDVFGYHLVNISFHILTSMFLFLFVFHTLNLPLLRPKYGSNAYFIALLSAVFWAINPVQTQAVTYIVQRMASMAAMFYIMAMYFYLKGRTSTKINLRIGHYVLCVICGILAIGSKENAVMLPFGILLFDLFLIQGISKPTIKKNLTIFLAILLTSVGVTLILKGPSLFNPETLFTYPAHRPFSLIERLLTEPRIVLFYISLLFYPMAQRLNLCHDIHISHGLLDPPTTIISMCVIIGLLCFCVIRSRRWPLLCFCIFFFFLNHIIEGTIFPLELIFEHRNYLPSMFLFVPVAILLVKGIRFYSHERTMQAILSVFIILVLIGFGHSTFSRNFDWKTNGTLWADSVKKAPDIRRPHINLGCYYMSQNMLEKALAEFTSAASSRIICNLTDRGTTLFDIGYIHHKKGNLDQALEYYHKSAEAYPKYADTHNNMGMIYAKKGQTEKAMEAFQQAIRFSANPLKPIRNAGLLLLKENQVDKALVYFNKALDINSNNAGVLGATGYAHRLKGSYGKAFPYFEKAMGMKVHDPKLHLYMSEIFFKRGMRPQAEKQIQEFTRRGRKADLLGYVLGTAKEDNNDRIRPYKKLVMQGLVRAYENTAFQLGKRTKYLTEKITEMGS